MRGRRLALVPGHRVGAVDLHRSCQHRTAAFCMYKLTAEDTQESGEVA